uniref:Uncharacterized protein n=2 Tax=Oryza TaxID=4527 RepID=A0A0D3FAI1_9ORYZ
MVDWKHFRIYTILPFIGFFAVTIFFFNSTIPIILKICGLNASDMWGNNAEAQPLAFDLGHVDWICFVAFAGMAAGLVIYSYKPSFFICHCF